MACECGCDCCGPAKPEEETGVQPPAELEREKHEADGRLQELEERVRELETAAS